MFYLLLEGLRTMMSSGVFGMDDGIDRLTRKHTVLLVLLGALIIGSNRYIGAPVSCATTEQTPGMSQHWIDTFCWITDRQMAPIQIIGNSHMKKATSFYQFTVETLFLVAIIASLPGCIWRAALGRSGFKLKSIAQLVSAAKQSVGAPRETHLKALAEHIEISRRYRRPHWTFDRDLHRLSKVKTIWLIGRLRTRTLHQNRFFIPTIYILIKVIYICTIITIFYVLTFCLGFDFPRFGLSIIENFRYKNRTSILDDHLFPQRTGCLISGLKQDELRETWADCLLPINVINNIIFSFLWFWLIFLFIASIYGFFRSALKLCPFSTRLFLSQHLRAQRLYTTEDRRTILKFIKNCPLDVVLVLRLCHIELDDTLVGEIIKHLYLTYRNEYIPIANNSR